MVPLNQIRFKIFLSVLFLLGRLCFCQENEVLYRCGADDLEFKPIVDEGIPLNNSQLLKRKLDSEGFKEFKIYFDPTNLRKKMIQYNITQYENIFFDSIQKVIETLQKLLRIKPLQADHSVTLHSLHNADIECWDVEKFGNESFLIQSTGYDLILFGTVKDLGESTLASAGQWHLEGKARPYTGRVNINYKFNYSKENSQEYFQALLMHEFTHVLGFSKGNFDFYFHNIFYKNDTYGITRAYINSTKVLEVARKYFNCSDLDGVALEEIGGTGTAGSHWDARELYGEYMNGYLHETEQVISEFTLALLEDTGNYKANYYTGGLMRYGKNKGCSFVRDDCVSRINHTINPYFENEFFDSLISETCSNWNPSCSSGRQSRTVFYFSYYGNLSENYRYFENNIGGYQAADYCPVARTGKASGDTAYFSTQCSKKGNGRYGDFMCIYKNGRTVFNTNEQINSIIGEVISDSSFCFLSSLIKDGTEDINAYSRIPRAICYELFCSERTLTVQIHDDFIVCPRSGGKIKVEGYEGYFLCPDYNLMCSGTVICNDMFDCVDKKSVVKNSSYYYDYKIKTSQNIEDAQLEEEDNKTNYELSENATCPIYCKHCKENKRCIKCKEDFGLVGNSENVSIECINLNQLNTGYYKLENDTYYKCMSNCEICKNSTICEKCYSNYDLLNGTCIKKTENCQKYNKEGICELCNENFAFNKTERNSCINKDNFSDYYTPNDGISYYPCNENISDCKYCNYNKAISNVKCNICKDNYVLLDSENKCYSKSDLNQSYFYINDTHIKKCSEEIENCEQCDSQEKCNKCIENYYLFNDEKKICYEKSQIPIEYCYLNEENTTYYSCNNSIYNLIENCKSCSNKNSCSFCQDEYTFINKNKSFCIEKNEIEGKYIPDMDDTSNYIKCSDFINNCSKCNNSQCSLCETGFIFIDDNFTKCISIDSINLDIYFTNDNITYYSCINEKYKNEEKCKIIFETSNIIYNNNFSSVLIIDSLNKESDTISEKINTSTTVSTLVESSNITNIPSSNLINSTIIESNIRTTNSINSTIIGTTIPNTNSIIETNISTINIINSTIIEINISTTNSIRSTIIESNINITNSINSTIIESNIPIINSSNTTIIETNIPTTNLIKSTIMIPSTSLNINTSSIPTILNINTTSISSTLITTNPSIYATLPTTNINSTITTKNKIIFVLQIQIINKRLKLFILANFVLSENDLFTFNINIYLINKGRILQQSEIKEMNFTISKLNSGNADSIIELISIEEINEDTKATLIDSKVNNDIEVIFNKNVKNLDTEKVKNDIKNGGIDYNNLPSDHKIYHYSIISSTQGCQFDLISEKNIENKDKNLNLDFINLYKNNITARCFLSKSNGNKIPCTLEKDLYNVYSLKPYLYSDDKETITISQDNIDKNIILECSIEFIYKKKSSGLSAGAIIGIICAIIGVIAILILIYYFLIRGRNKNNISNIRNTMTANSDEILKA